MVIYNFKKIQKVPESSDFIDIFLSRTQRKTPTVVHPNYAIHRIRSFYMRKVKFSQVTICDKITQIIEDFPRLEDIHPFYADLLNVLYDKDTYKLALGQLNSAKNVIQVIGRDYLRLLKYGESLYGCKQLKRAALGRMATMVKKQKGPLAYLEQVRKHLTRLPSIDPSTRTLIIAGYPNVGKSSFINKITRANVDVQPYAFTTKSLFVGHTDYKHLQWQVIDTPGILDHPLEDRNTIEMQSITALAHLRSCILFVIDMSEQCGHSIKHQVNLFNSIKPLFTNKPIVIILSKADLITYDKLSQENKDLLEGIVSPSSSSSSKDLIQMVAISNISGIGIGDAKKTACDLLLQHRVETKLSKGGKVVQSILNRIHHAKPTQTKKEDLSEANIPKSVIIRREKRKILRAKRKFKKPSSTTTSTTSTPNNNSMQIDDEDEEFDLNKIKKLEKDIVNENGGCGIYSIDFKKHYKLKSEQWKYDKIPEFKDGKNIADFIDPEIQKKLDELEKEEEIRIGNGEEDEFDFGSGEYFISEKEEKLNNQIEKKKFLTEHHGSINRKRKKARLPKKFRGINLSKIAEELAERGVDKETLEIAKERTRSVSKVRRALSTAPVSRGRSISEARNIEEKNNLPSLGKRKRTMTPSNRSLSAIDKYAGFVSEKKKEEAVKLANKKRRFWAKDSKAGEGDRRIYDLKPKHLFSGKINSTGKRDRR